MMNYTVYQNGKEVNGELPFDLMRTEAIGIFESMRAYDGRILHEGEHLSRLLESAKTVGYRPFPELVKLRNRRICPDCSLGLAESGPQRLEQRPLAKEGGDWRFDPLRIGRTQWRPNRRSVLSISPECSLDDVQIPPRHGAMHSGFVDEFNVNRSDVKGESHFFGVIL